MSDVRDHWLELWSHRAPEEVGWFEAAPLTGLELIGAVAPDRDSHVVDVGGGASRLVDGLLDEGYTRVTVVDLAESALQASRRRLGLRAAQVEWITADVRALQLPAPADVWHDRAVFHFLTEGADRAAYREVLRRSLRPGGHLVIGTFAPSGPERCSGLPVERYDADTLGSALGPGFDLVKSLARVHVTPSGAHQPYTWCVLQRRGED